MGDILANAAYELIGWFEEMRTSGNRSPLAKLALAAEAREVSTLEAIRTLGLLARRVDHMLEELRATGKPVEHFAKANDAWTKAAFRLGSGWVEAGSISADGVIAPGDLDLLHAFAGFYDMASSLPRPSRVVLDRFIAELEPIAEYIRGLNIADSSRSLILRKVESAKVLLEGDDVQFDVILTRLGEILGLMVILAESLPDGEEKETIWTKTRGFAGNFARDMTVNIVSGAISAAGMGAIGM